MADISAAMVKELREKTGAGMMDCKKALVEAEGDVEKAIDNLRKSGIAKAEKKSGRSVKEGKITSQVSGNKGALLEVLCETDFVAKNPKFQEYIKSTVEKLFNMDGNGDLSGKLQETEKETLVSLIATIGENMQIRRAVRWESQGSVASYLHMGGRIGVIADVEGTEDQDLLNDICMHIAAFKPLFVCPDEIPSETVEKEKEIAAAQMSGKPPEIIEKIITGKINKWYTEVCLVKQPWIRDDKQCLAKLDSKVKVKRFLRWEIGEEIE